MRKKVGLTRSEADRIEEIAAAEGFSSAKWIVALIRARLTKTAQFGQSELEALTESNLRLHRIGRNLNQIARALNTSLDERHLYRVEMIEALSRVISEHTKHVSHQITANIARWRIK
ncbi:MAG: plasmid mobilization relaxosome protein MobC [Burkholderiales bacterium]|nr:plasmid mobilization relaxosome protein MobC [Burkholderiales bacterium]